MMQLTLVLLLQGSVDAWQQCCWVVLLHDAPTHPALAALGSARCCVRHHVPAGQHSARLWLCSHPAGHTLCLCHWPV